MSQVEGGDLLVLQRSTESRQRSSSQPPQGYKGGVLGNNSGRGWSDGPWWREEGARRDLGVVQGMKEGTRLCRVGAEASAREFFEREGGVEAAAKRAAEGLSGSNPVRSSDIFLSIQAVGSSTEGEHFAADPREEWSEEGERVFTPAEAEEAEEVVQFAVYLHDPLHSLSFSALSQGLPRKWANWLDAQSSDTNDESGLPDSIQQILAEGGVDPREWVAEWMEESLALAVGVVAQKYVARRMGVGEGGLGRGKRRIEEDDNAGEAARAL